MTRTHIQDKRRLQLIQATLDSIATRGINETTITHICKGAGLSRGIVNFYFTSKEMLMQESLKHVLEEKDSFWRDALERAKTDNPHEPLAALYALIGAHFSQKICQRKKLAILSAFWGHAAAHKPYSAQLKSSDEALVNELSTLWQTLTGADAEKVQHVTLRLHALIRGLWLSFMLNPTKETRLSYAEECEHFILEQLEIAGTHARMEQAQTAQHARAALTSKHLERPLPSHAANDRTEEDAAIGDLFAQGS